MICSACKRQAPDDSRFCPGCGAAVDLANTPTVSRVSDSARATPASSPPPRGSSPGSRHPSSGSASGYEANYVPGMTLLERYRIVAPLGKGGMGEVYRAEDLKLGQSVALKFLPASLLRSEDAVARFHREVRLARQVSHPNVCRVFDVGEAGGQTFLTMEYVDGEDLASLMRRIGRLPPDKALDIARQLCAGLAAAHEHGIVHRDLKPANIMLDGRGRVRITDFGLAAISLEPGADDARAGTPAYMSPEQLSGGEITPQSDLYSVGLVLYEIYTGKRPFDAKTFDEMVRQRDKSTPTLPSQYVKEIDPLVERVIMRCLERDPSKRPTAALQVAAALPGGDPLAAALAAGETPSPEMVAAAGEDGALQPWKAWALFGGIALLLACCTFLSQHAFINNLVPGEKSPEVLSATGREIANSLGYTERPVDSAYWFGAEADYWAYLSQVPAPERYRRASEDFPSGVQFRYRQSPQPIQANYVRTEYPWLIYGSNPVASTPGDMTVGLDTQGRLQSFHVIPYPEQNGATPAVTSFDWRGLFERAGLDFSQAKAAPSGWYANQLMDQQFAWDAAHDGKNTQVHGAMYKGRVVLFDVLGPWERPVPAEYSPPAGRYVAWTFFGVVVCLELICLFFARKNMQVGRGDTKGALRGAIATFAACFVWILLAAHRYPDGDWFFEWWQIILGRSAGLALQWWVLYMALEPYIRRTYPEALISWSRLVAGSFRNALVGRDILSGVGFGALVSAIALFANALPSWFSIRGVTPPFIPDQFREISVYVGHFGLQAGNALINSLGSLAIVFFAWKLFRSKTAALIAISFFWTLLFVVPENPLGELPFSILIALVLLVCLIRAGLLGLIVALFTNGTLIAGCLTTDLGRWYAPRSVATLLVVLAIAACGFWISTSGRSRFGTAFED
ncbi:MAG TPA: serine/threonine-protein kinase [Candidatus Acidoferrales bacterium]|nr:serine/threonine-protein kinase [Candidatus Acidoferrales bacterium]